MEKKGVDLLKEKYSFDEKKYLEIMLDNYIRVIEGLSLIETTDFFDTEMSAKKYISNVEGFFKNVPRVFSFLKNHSANNKQAIVIFIYSVSVLIDNFCCYLENLTMPVVSINPDESVSMKCVMIDMLVNNLSADSIHLFANRIKQFVESEKMTEWINKYRAFYEVRRESLKELNHIIENVNDRSIQAKHDDTGFFPFEYLRNSLEWLYKLLTEKLPD